MFDKMMDAMKAAKLEQNTYQATGMGRLFDFCNGRATTFAIVFAVSGIMLAFTGKLTGEFVALVGAVQTLVFCHSWKDDLHDQRMSRIEMEGKVNGTEPVGAAEEKK